MNDYVQQERSWSKDNQAPQTIAKTELTRNKLMLCIGWDWKDIIHCELLPPSKTINLNLYCRQLMRLMQEAEKKRLDLINRKSVVLHHDNARPQTSLATQHTLKEFGWEMLMHAPYGPDLTPSDFYLFQSLQNSLGSVSISRQKMEKVAFVLTKTIEGKTIQPSDVLCAEEGPCAQEVSRFRKTDEVGFWKRWFARAVLQRLQLTLTSARPQENQNERAAELRSILQSGEEVTDCD
ncbi:Histone-lysine N-methyltransferase SETMAR [Eumeta japonica]|uniref:Histone-lysine N-methyltransferase SETMAR n=1 Tax=Eumeta variegata TaxID=151549 RepID=A0A4C1XWR0_EUMVA|nr:Histone-lysine N-methyltransferase SETMAR [Eumeta japonica]